jgi:hypothetical protein
MQITYAGHPLYFYAHEWKYQVLCWHPRGSRPRRNGAPIPTNWDAVDHPCELGSCCLGDDVDERRQRDLVMPGAPRRGQRLSRHELGASPVSRLNARLKASSES